MLDTPDAGYWTLELDAGDRYWNWLPGCWGYWMLEILDAGDIGYWRYWMPETVDAGDACCFIIVLVPLVNTLS